MRRAYGWAVVAGLALAGAAAGGGCELVAGFGNPILGNPNGSGGNGTSSSTSTSTSASSSSTSASSSSSSSSSSGKPSGAPCSMNGDCMSGSCADNGMDAGICCMTPCSGGFACGAGGTCKTTCTTNADCATNGACVDGGTCLLAQGKPCADAGECVSTYCTDGVCCEMPCANSQCYGCSAKLTGGVDGKCAIVLPGTVDPRGLCVNNTHLCKGDNTCVDGGLCNTYTPPGTLCGGSCDSQTNSMTFSTCSDAGACDVPVPGVTEFCTHAACESYEGFNSCACQSDADCPAQLPYCYSDPAFGTCIGSGACASREPGWKCCLSSGCVPESTLCVIGWCAAEPYTL